MMPTLDNVFAITLAMVIIMFCFENTISSKFAGNAFDDILHENVYKNAFNQTNYSSKISNISLSVKKEFQKKFPSFNTSSRNQLKKQTSSKRLPEREKTLKRKASNTSDVNEKLSSISENIASSLLSVGSLESECDCGARIQPKIIGGQAASMGKYPFVAAIFTLMGRGSFCGASIVNERYLLTAAHCVARHASQPQLYHVVVGRTDLNISNMPDELMTKVERIWLNAGRINDIALVRIMKPIRFSRYVKPACFGGYSAKGNSANINGKFAFDSSSFNNAANVKEVMNRHPKTLTAIGWGYTGWQKTPNSIKLSPIMTTKLQEVTLNEVTCVKESYLICVAAEGKSPCFGDSGSPLLYTSMGKQYVIGLTSRSSSAHAKYCIGAPTIYERTSHYLPWIRTITQNRFCQIN